MTTGDRLERVRGLGLLSGGLDSRLAICVLKDQGIEMHGVVFESPFFGSRAARQAAIQLGIPLQVLDMTRDILGLLEKPKHGFGGHMNPCIDCHALMLRRAGAMMAEQGFHFISTGEVLNERPMSQTRKNLEVVARESGYGDYVLRPLSAKHLPETQPERMGWVDRTRLLDFEGRSRKPQLRLAARYGVKDFPSPAGGCRLTEPNFCKRLKDLKDHEGLQGIRAIELLRVGRHFRLASRVKLIVGRNEEDNALLEGSAELHDLVLKIEDVPGPTGLLPQDAGEEHIQLAAGICARYSDAAAGAGVTVRVNSAAGLRKIRAVPLEREKLDPFWI